MNAPPVVILAGFAATHTQGGRKRGVQSGGRSRPADLRHEEDVPRRGTQALASRTSRRVLDKAVHAPRAAGPEARHRAQDGGLAHAGRARDEQ